MSEHDPGDLYEGPPPHHRRRRAYRRESEIDDAWAAADENDFYDDNVEIEDLAAGYVWEESERLGVGYDEEDDDLPAPGLGPLPPGANRLSQRVSMPRQERIRHRYDRSHAYPDSPSFHKNKQNPVDRALSRVMGEDLTIGKTKRDLDELPGWLGQLPFWAILLLVILAFAAFAVTVLACVAVLALL